MNYSFVPLIHFSNDFFLIDHKRYILFFEFFLTKVLAKQIYYWIKNTMYQDSISECQGRGVISEILISKKKNKINHLNGVKKNTFS